MAADGIQKRDQLEVGTIGECDQRVMGADIVPAAADDGEAGGGVVANRGFEIRNDDHEVIDRFEHALLLRIGARGWCKT